MTTLQYWNLTQNVIYYTNCYNLKILKNISNEKTGAECTFLEDKDNQVYLMFKGTELKLNDIFCDLLFKKIPVFVSYLNKFLNVHAGFYLQYMSIIEDISKFLSSSYSSKYKEIIVIGHSLGGALAQLFCLDRGFDISYCIIFGSPNISSERISNEFKIINYQNVNDIIAYLPPKFLNYHQVGNIIKLGKFNFWKLFNIKKEHQGYNQFFKE